MKTVDFQGLFDTYSISNDNNMISENVQKQRNSAENAVFLVENKTKMLR